MTNRLLFLDTETTGLDIIDNSSKYPNHRLTEIAVVESIDFELTGKVFHTYLNPGRHLSATAYRITGLTYDFLKTKPKFGEVAEEFLEFIGTSKLVIHNAKFDLKFLNFELSLLNKPSLSNNEIIDTMILARAKYPGQRASLDALCKKFNIDNSSRVLHGALLDAQLLARVYANIEDFAFQFSLLKNDSTENDLKSKFDSSKLLLLKANDDDRMDHLNLIEQIISS